MKRKVGTVRAGWIYGMMRWQGQEVKRRSRRKGKVVEWVFGLGVIEEDARPGYVQSRAGNVQCVEKFVGNHVNNSRGIHVHHC